MIKIQEVTKKYGDQIVLNKIDLTIPNVGLVVLKGANGSGKTSLLKFILTENIQYHGSFYMDNKIKISYICQKYDNLKGTLIDFVYENQLDQTKFFNMLFKLGFSREQFQISIDCFSEGQKKKVLIAKSLCEEANLYIWDEPLNYIDVISRIQIEELLKDSDITLIFVEHDVTFIKNIATKIVEIK